MADWRANPRKKRSIIWKLPVEELRLVVARSTSIAEVLRYFDLNNKGGNCKTLMARVEYEGINASHINRGLGSNRGKKFPNKGLPLEDILTENSTYGRFHLKRRLIANGILKEVCAECGLEKVWNNKPLNLQLDHVNGIADDNRLENLRLLCPNCHSQTHSFAGRNIRKLGGRLKVVTPSFEVGDTGSNPVLPSNF